MRTSIIHVGTEVPSATVEPSLWVYTDGKSAPKLYVCMGEVWIDETGKPLDFTKPPFAPAPKAGGPGPGGVPAIPGGGAS